MSRVGEIEVGAVYRSLLNGGALYRVTQIGTEMVLVDGYPIKDSAPRVHREMQIERCSATRILVPMPTLTEQMCTLLLQAFKQDGMVRAAEFNTSTIAALVHRHVVITGWAVLQGERRQTRVVEITAMGRALVRALGLAEVTA